MVNQKVTYSFAELGEQLFFVSQALHAMACTKLSQDGKGVTSFPVTHRAAHRRDLRALQSICLELYKFGLLDDVQIQQSKIVFRAGQNKTRLNLSDFWSQA